MSGSIADIIHEQVSTNKVVLYMKGTPKFPMCGFSGRAVKILSLCGVKDFLAVNVLEDEEIRQGIKTYSNWPTIPQLYVNGQLVGGSDIMAEMYESGELEKITQFLNLAQIRALEQQAFAKKINLIELAGTNIACWITSHCAKNSKILVLLGKGNNGADGCAAAVALQQAGFSLTLLTVMEQLATDAEAYLVKCRALGCTIWDRLPDSFSALISEYDVIIDAILGIGINSSLGENLQTIITIINESKKTIIALDTPSGLNPFTGELLPIAIKADYTLTLISDKPGFYTGEAVDLVGIVTVLPLINSADYVFNSAVAPQSPNIKLNSLSTINYLPLIRQKRNTNKGSFGTVAIIGGASGMHGAVHLAGRSAMLMGSGKVVLSFIDGSSIHIDSYMPEIMVWQLDDVIQRLAEFSAIVIGPGFGELASSVEILSKIIAQPALLSAKLVVDADALNILANNAQLATQFISLPNKIITPHPAEAGRLLGLSVKAVIANRFQALEQLYSKFKAITLLKGAGSLIKDSAETVYINSSGNVALSQAGQGDSLCGMIAAFIAQGLTLADALRMAVYLHGLGAENMASKLGGFNGISAREIILSSRQLLNNILYN